MVDPHQIGDGIEDLEGGRAGVEEIESRVKKIESRAEIVNFVFYEGGENGGFSDQDWRIVGFE